jgi:hypothetical protein
MTLKVEGVVNGGMHAEETLGRSSRFEPLHLALSSPYRLVRVLGPIVAPKPLFVWTGQSQTAERRAVGAQLVGHQQRWRKPLLSEELAHQPQRRPAVAATLYQHVEDLAFVVHRTPEIHLLAGDPDHQASGAGQLHPRALSEPDVILSHHPAPIVRPRP